MIRTERILAPDASRAELFAFMAAQGYAVTSETDRTFSKPADTVWQVGPARELYYLELHASGLRVVGGEDCQGLLTTLGAKIALLNGDSLFMRASSDNLAERLFALRGLVFLERDRPIQGALAEALARATQHPNRFFRLAIVHLLSSRSLLTPLRDVIALRSRDDPSLSTEWLRLLEPPVMALAAQG